MRFSLVAVSLIVATYGVNVLVSYIIGLRNTIEVLRHDVARLEKDKADQKAEYERVRKADRDWAWGRLGKTPPKLGLDP